MSYQTISGDHSQHSALSGESHHRIRVLIVDDHDLFREGLRQLLQADQRIEVVGEAATGHEAITQVRILQPDVVLMDITMPGMDGVRATEQIRTLFPGTHVIMLTMHDNALLEEHAAQAGAAQYLVKNARSEELFQAIHHIAINGSEPHRAAPVPTAMPSPAQELLPVTATTPPEPINTATAPTVTDTRAVPPQPVLPRDTGQTLPLLALTEQEIETLLNEQLALLEAQLERLLAHRGLTEGTAAVSESAEVSPRILASAPSHTQATRPEPPRTNTHTLPEASDSSRSSSWWTARRIAQWGDIPLVVVAGGMLALALGWAAPDPVRQLALGLIAAVTAITGGTLATIAGRSVRSTVEAALGLASGAAWMAIGIRTSELPLSIGLAVIWALAVATAAAGVWTRHSSLAVVGLAGLLLSPMVAPGPILTPLVLAAQCSAWVIAALAFWWWQRPGVGLLTLILTAPYLVWAAFQYPQEPARVMVALGVLWLVEAVMLASARASTIQRSQYHLLVMSLTSACVSAIIGLLALAHATAPSRGAFLAVLGIAECCLSGILAYRHGQARWLIDVTGGFGIGALALSFALALPGPLAVIGWAMLALFLAWYGDEQRDRLSHVGSALLGGLALSRFLLVDMPIAAWRTHLPIPPLVVLEAVSLAGVLAAGAGLVRIRPAQSLLLTGTLMVALLTLPHIAAGPLLLIGKSGLALLGIGLIYRSQLGTVCWPLWPISSVRVSPLWIPTGLASLLAIGQAFSTALAPSHLGLNLLPSQAMTSEASLTGAILAAAVLVAGHLVRNVLARRITIVVAVLIGAYAATGELPNASFLLSWCALAVGLLALLRQTRIE